MMEGFNIEALVGGFPSIIARKDHPGIYEMKGGSKKAGAQKVDFIQQLFGLCPIRLIWLKNVDKGLAKALGNPLSTSGEANLWMLSDTISLPQFLDGLFEGGWAMFFLRNSPQHKPTPPEFLPTKLEDVRILLRAFGASAAILSWYDDIEWQIVTLVEEN